MFSLPELEVVEFCLPVPFLDRQPPLNFTDMITVPQKVQAPGKGIHGHRPLTGLIHGKDFSTGWTTYKAEQSASKICYEFGDAE